jgi:hypothetical protein
MQALASLGVKRDAQQLFAPAALPRTPQVAKRGASPSTVTRFPAPPPQDPNTWVPTKLRKERMKARHPTTQAQGERLSLMQPQPRIGRHPFTPTLQQWSDIGCPVDCGPDWDWTTIEEAVRRGPHQSALEPESLITAQEDIAYQVQAGFCQIYAWEDLQTLRPRGLKISPMAVVPQKNRRGRIILDLSFPVYRPGSGRKQ